MIELLSVMGNDLTVVNAARVSLNKWHSAFDLETDTKLISYLARNNHFTPFAQPQIQLRITAPIFVARQWFRSNVGTTRNEVSRRYVDSEPAFYKFKQLRARPAKSIKQGSGEALDKETNEDCLRTIGCVQDYCVAAYRGLLANGVAPEQARTVLPQTLETSWIEVGSLAYWARFVSLRIDEHAQKEIRDYAEEIYRIMEELFPISWGALNGDI